YQNLPHLIEANEHIVKQCSVQLDFNQRLLPASPVPKDESASEYLKTLCFDLLTYRYEEGNQVAQKRLKYELSIIDELEFSDYFVIVQCIVQFAKKQHYVVGPGRGSSAGTIVDYVICIRILDPLKYDLLFKRFL